MHRKNPCARINFLNGLVDNEFIALEGTLHSEKK